MVENSLHNQDSDNQLLQDRAIHLFTYLKEIAQLRTKIIRDCLDYEELLWFDEIPREKGCYTIAWGSKAEDFDSIWIEIRKRKEPQCPGIPSPCSEWINPDALFDSTHEPQLNERIPRFISDEDYEYINLNDNPEVSETWQKYINESWHPWAEEQGEGIPGH
jgi:hypothetical protein